MRRWLSGLLVFGTVFAGIGNGLPAAETHPLSVHDMLAMERISDTRVSPDGRRLVFNLRTTDLEANRGRTDLWVVGADGTGLRRLTSDPAADFNARWSPCGQCVFFLSTRSGSSQVWHIRTDGGEARQVTRLPLDIGTLTVSPDGGTLAVTMDVFPGESAESTARKLDEGRNRKSSGRIYEELFVRHWDAWSDGRRSHLFVVPAAGGAAKDLMSGMSADTPSKPFGGPEEIAFTPDGKGIVFTARDAGREEAWSTNMDLFYVPIDGSEKPRCLTGANKAWDTTPVFSPDGKTLAYLAMARPGYEADRFRIVLKPWPEGPERILTEAWDYSVASLCWPADGTKILATAPDRGTSRSSRSTSGPGTRKPSSGRGPSPRSGPRRAGSSSRGTR